MFGMFKKRPKLPPLTEGVLSDIGTAKRQIGIQCEEFFGRGKEKLPYISTYHELCFLGYSIGVLNGVFQSTRSPVQFAKGDRALEALGRGVSEMSLVVGIMACHDRISIIADVLEILLQKKPEVFSTMEAFGGTDGMALCANEPLQTGGLLGHFLRNNVTPEEKAAARWS